MFHSYGLFTDKMQYFLFEYFLWKCYQGGHGTDAQVISTGTTATTAGSTLSVILTLSLLSSVHSVLLLGRPFTQSKPLS